MKQLTFIESGSGYAAEFSSEGAVVVQMHLAIQPTNATARVRVLVRARVSPDMPWCMVDVIKSSFGPDVMFSIDLPVGLDVQLVCAFPVTKGVLL